MELYSDPDPSNHMGFNSDGDIPLENYATVSLLHQLKTEVIEMFRSEMKIALNDFTATSGLEGMKADITKLTGDLAKETNSRTDYDTRSTLSIEKIIEEIVQIHLKVMKVEEDIGNVSKKCEVRTPPAPVKVPGLKRLLNKVEVMSEEMVNQFREIKQAQVKIQEEMEAVKGDLEGMKEEMRKMKEENEKREVMSAPAPVEAAMEVEEVQDNQVDTRSDPKVENPVDNTSGIETRKETITILVGQSKPAAVQIRDILNPKPGSSKSTTRRQSTPQLIPLLNTPNDSKNDDVQLLTVHGRNISNTSEFECLCGEKFKMLGNLFAHIQKFVPSSSNPVPRRAKRTGVSLCPSKVSSSRSSVSTVPVTVENNDEDATPTKVSRPGRYSMVKCRCGCGQLFNSESDDHLGKRSEPEAEAQTEKEEAVSDILLSSMAKKIRQKLKAVTTKVREQRQAQASSENSTASNGSEGNESTTAENDVIEKLD